MSSEVDLLRSLDDEPDTPSTVDIRRAIATARRRRTHRTVGYTGAAAVTALAVAGTSVGISLVSSAGEPAPLTTVAAPSATPATSAPAETPPPTGCKLSVLPTPDKDPMALVSGADPTAEYIVGRSYPKAGGYQAVIWHDGEVSKVMLPGDLEESLRDVNSSGTAVGWSYSDTGNEPYAFRDGEITRLAGVKHGSAQAINSSGVILGQDDDANRPLYWASVDAKPIRLPVPSGVKEADAGDIDEDGTMVGSLDLSKPYVWFADGTHRELPMPVIDGKPAAIAQAHDIRNGWVTGMASAERLDRGSGPSSPIAAVRWNLGTGEVAVVAELSTPADDVNAQGWQIGSDRKGYAVLVTDAGTVKLPDLGKHRDDGTATIASTINNDGRIIAGQSDDKTSTIQAVVWRCR